MVGQQEILINLEGIVDKEEERNRLRREIEKVAKDIDIVGKKLQNKRFVDQAPADLVEGVREKLQHHQERRQKYEEALRRLTP